MNRKISFPENGFAELTITYTLRDLKDALSVKLDNILYGMYAASILKRAGVPRKKELMDLMLADDKFMSIIKRYMRHMLLDIGMELCEGLYSDINAENSKPLHEALEAVKQAEKEEQAEGNLSSLILELQKHGYEVRKK